MGSFSSMTAIATNLPAEADRDYKSQSHTHTKKSREEDNGRQIRGCRGDESPLSRAGKEKKEAPESALFIHHSNIKLA